MEFVLSNPYFIQYNTDQFQLSRMPGLGEEKYGHLSYISISSYLEIVVKSVSGHVLYDLMFMAGFPWPLPPYIHQSLLSYKEKSTSTRR